jgi:thioredoxin 1
LSGYLGGIEMQKISTRAVGIFMLVFFVISMIGAATTCTPSKANPDTFNFSPAKYSGNVLSNDKGSDIKVVSVSKTTNGGKISIKSNGIFSYKPASSSKTNIKDTFIYKIKNKCGQYSSAKVTINYKNAQEDTISVVQVTQLAQINNFLKKGPVFVKIGAEWCTPCQKMKPILKELATEYGGKASITFIDTDKSPKLADYFGVDSIPDSFVIVGIKNGQYVYMKQNGKVTTDRSQARIIGLYDKEVFEKVINLALQ